MSELFFALLEWQPNNTPTDRKIKVDMVAGYQLAEYCELRKTLGYRIPDLDSLSRSIYIFASPGLF